MEEIKSRKKEKETETEGKEYAEHLISGRKCGRMKNTHKIRGRKERGGNKVKKIVKVLISRLFITVLLILLQFGYLFYLLLEVGKMSTYINLILNILAFIVALFVVNESGIPAGMGIYYSDVSVARIVVVRGIWKTGTHQKGKRENEPCK